MTPNQINKVQPLEVNKHKEIEVPPHSYRLLLDLLNVTIRKLHSQATILSIMLARYRLQPHTFTECAARDSWPHSPPPHDHLVVCRRACMNSPSPH